MQVRKFLFAGLLFFGLLGLIEIFSFASVDQAPPAYALQLPTSEIENSLVESLNIPQNISFAGERMPTEQMEPSERLDRELLVNAYWQSQTILLIKKANRWFPLIEPILKDYGIPDDIKYVALAESGLSNVVSPAGAAGFWQFIKETGKRYGLEISEEVDERYQLEKATLAACVYFKQAYEEFGSWTMAAASYNMGIEGLKRQVAKQKQTDFYQLYLNEETARYIYRIAALKEVYTHQQQYGFKIHKKHMYPVVPTKMVEVDSSITDMVAFAESQGITYKNLKQYNPWVRQNALKNPTNKTYWFKIPDPNFSYSDFLKNAGE